MPTHPLRLGFPGSVLNVSMGAEARPGPFVTIRAGGPLNGVVTITAITGSGGRCLVEASWTQDDGAFSQQLEAATHAMARALAQAAANQFAVGNRPKLERD